MSANSSDPSGGGNLAMVLGFAGLFLAAGTILGAKYLIENVFLPPQCEAACSALGMEDVAISHQGSRSVRASYHSPNTCMCRRDPAAPVPPSCTEASTANVACDAGYWFDGGSWILSIGVNLLFALALLTPTLLWLVQAYVRAKLKSRRR
jgi:hypothetical protein